MQMQDRSRTTFSRVEIHYQLLSLCFLCANLDNCLNSGGRVLVDLASFEHDSAPKARRASGRAGLNGIRVKPIESADQFFAERVQDDLRGVVNIQLLQQFGTVAFDRIRANVEKNRNFLVRLSFREQLQHFFLACSQKIERIGETLLLKDTHVVLKQRFGDGPAEKG